MEDRILYRQVRSVKAGQVERFKIEYTPESNCEPGQPPNLPSNLWVKIKNRQLIALRAAYLAGPYVLYADCRPEDYDPNTKCFITAEQPVFEPQILPGQSFYAELSCHTFKESYCWIVDVVSQILFNNTIEVDFEIIIGTSKNILHETSFPEKKVANSDKTGTFVLSTMLVVHNFDTLDLWNLPVPDPKKPIHLVILTHGLHSNVGADLLFLKEQIDKCKGENIVVKGYFGNIGRTERGIKYLGSRVAEYLVDLVKNTEPFKGNVSKVSFIGHSLGGLVQTFAIAYLETNFPWFFETITPINFITLASPLLGVVNENPIYVKFALLAGIVGLTGQDLGLKYFENNSKPLLLLLPTGPTHQVLKRFVRRTIYANAINDGVVPLRTSSLLYLDYKGLSQIINSTENKANELHVPESSSGKVPNNPQVEGKEDKGISPVLAVLSYFMPQKQSKNVDDEYHKFQTNGDEEQGKEDEYKLLPRSSVLETATALILPPLPSMKYITDPDSRDNIIIHDKMYHESDLPPPDSQANEDDVHPKENNSYSSRMRRRLLEHIDYEIDHLEEQIAREYHKNMSWRKVIVKLKPDSHNNIIVRRTFSNAYGWPVIEHLVANHFRIPEESQKSSNKIKVKSADASTDSLDVEVDLSSIIARDLITKQNDVIDQEKSNQEEHHWINSKDNSDSLFAVGPTGLLSEVSEMVGNFKEQWFNYAVTSVTKDDEEVLKRQKSNRVRSQDGPEEPEDDTEDKDGDLGIARRLMGGFL
ncbi:uncharacterized protein CANTADRAFT_22712 [Suhomyces tanzawaensis NRRL Y-17324]|uniref:DUF676 domain-containing protein n=1 Tax=Suhomyces tanzawaensis NRRL Y-17324 TaxID=984487 RepID=A0A1E4SH60_9ASCO|nr:uncharacterized protein CANTADRAFT_22712 [Suhomyces tanzawaensis NRRL Y-17324]ODV78752.1 hypothetical protein CANTADRAFT_22712 [Suhomyces tanzawaensis NRRL Y-17324]